MYKELLDNFKNHLLARNETLSNYNAIQTFLKYCFQNNIDLNILTHEQINTFFINSKYSINTKNNLIKASRKFYIINKLVNPVWNEIKYIKPDKKIPDYLTEEEINQAIAYLKTYHGRTFGLYKVEALLWFMFYSGCRKEEIIALKRHDINLAERVAKVFGKGRKERFVYFPKEIVKLFNKYFSSEQEEINAFNISVNQFTHIFRVIQKYFPEKNIHPHIIRHSAGRDMIIKGVPITIVQEILGHASVTTTQIYTSATQKMVQTMYNQKMNCKTNEVT